MPQDRAYEERAEQIALDSAATHLLEECRMVLPGIQALFGFQLIAAFTPGFTEQLAEAGQRVHLVSIVLVVLAVALVMAPAALHRMSELRGVSERFIRLSSRLLLWSMLPLALGICLDVYLVAHVILDDVGAATGLAALLFAVFGAAWVVLPLREQRRDRRQGRR